MSKSILYSQVTEHFPFVPRPDDSVITIHCNSCIFCQGLITELDPHRGEQVSPSDARVFFNELTVLSTVGFRWALPSYLEAILCEESDYDLAEFFLYFFNFDQPEAEKVLYLKKVSIFSNDQLNYLTEVVKHIGRELDEVYSKDAKMALSEIERLKSTLPNK